MTIDKSFIEKIECMAETKELEIEGRIFTNKEIYPVKEPVASKLAVHTLTGLINYIETQKPEGAIIHVMDFDTVALISPLFGENKQREVFIFAEAYRLFHRFDTYLTADEFNTYLQTMFIKDDNLAAVLQLVGNLTQGTEAEFADDGVTQRVTAKAGVARVETVPVPNPVTLRPYRTFADIEQPESKFVLRIKADKDHGPKCALFEADGGAWKNDAIATINGWLTVATEGKTAIIA